MAITKFLLKGVKCRKSSGTYYFEVRISGSEKLFCNKIKSPEEGALCYDIVKRYRELEVDGKKRKTTVKLNYPEYSRSLRLEPRSLRLESLSSGKEEAMEIILKQAQAAVKNLPESLRRSTAVVSSPSPSNRSSSHQNVHGKPLVAKQNLPGIRTNQRNLQKIFEFNDRCNMSYNEKINERGMLEGNVADINANSGIIYPRESCPDTFTDSMAALKQLMTTGGKIPGILEMAEQAYKSEESKCLELRKLVEDHNFKVIAEILMDDGNETSGRQRANEDEILPRVLEDCPSGEQNECGVCVLDSEGYGPPGNPVVDVRPFWTDVTTPPPEMGLSQRVIPHEFDKVADENIVTCETFSVGCIGLRWKEVWNGSNPEIQFLSGVQMMGSTY